MIKAKEIVIFLIVNIVADFLHENDDKYTYNKTVERKIF